MDAPALPFAELSYDYYDDGLLEEINEPLLSQLDGWQVIDNHHLTREYTFPDFVTALERVNRVGRLAEQQGHHPDIYLTWGKVRIDIWTHKIDGLTESDFILAAKLDELGSP